MSGITTASAAGIQASESSALTTQDVAETDLTVNVRTIGGYLPVSRQTLERAAYSEAILFEDLIARYNAALDTGCLTGDGNSGTILGVFHTSGTVALSANSDGTLPVLWDKLLAAQETILSKWGGLGLKPDKLFMHPRRWAQLSSYLDTTGRPIFGYADGIGQAFNPAATGQEAYGFVGRIQGLDAYVDSNIPTNLDTNSNRDAVVVTCSNVVHLWERQEDPGTLALEQQAGTSLQVQLIAYGYAAFTAGRYPDATATSTTSRRRALGPRRSPGQAGSSARHKRIAARSCPMGPLDPWTSLRTRPVCAWLARLPGGRKRRAPLPE